LLVERRDRFAKLATLEMGKLIGEAGAKHSAVSHPRRLGGRDSAARQ
jgi:acyl-CoA reductase-like NAD-dependent aldehyde dehydrogenase